MGQQTSSQSPEIDPTRKSYYELLGIPKDANEDEIKKSYRRKALELHPDRNYGNVEEATRLFAEIQAAYEVLSDPQERAWYDSHEEAVLSGADGPGGAYDGSIRVTTSDDIAKLYANFTGKNDFTDSPNGFYTSLRETFQKLAKEEELAADNVDTTTPDYPSFGSAADEYEAVVRPFYSVWSNFSTKKDFAWKDIYRLSEAPDRRVRRAMEKENKRLRDEGIRDFNDTIRMLVAFVRKRDPRIKEATAISDAQRQKLLREQTAAQAARARAANKAKLDGHVEADWTKPANDEDEDPETIWNEEEEEPVEHYECVVCDKLFKTDKQFESHERSKKHLQAVKKIEREMRKEGKDLGLDHTSSAHPVVEDFEPAVKVDDDDDEEVAELKADHGNEYRASEAVKQPSEGENVADSVRNEDEPEDGATTAESASDDDYAPRDLVSARLVEDLEHLEVSKALHEQDPLSGKKVGKAKEKRARKAAKQASNSSSAQDSVCALCQAQFSSKSKLFEHLRENPSHAQPVQISKTSNPGKKRR